MPTAISKVDICNSALIKCGADRINDIDDDNARAKLCNERYDIIRKKLLFDHPWNFAIARAELAQVSTDPEYEWDYQFQLPADCLRVIDIEDDNTEWVIEGRYLLIDQDSVKIKYIKDLTQTGYFSPSFAEALAYALAADISYSLKQSTGHSEMLHKLAVKALAEARSFDAQEGYPSAVNSNFFQSFRS